MIIFIFVRCHFACCCTTFNRLWLIIVGCRTRPPELPQWKMLAKASLSWKIFTILDKIFAHEATAAAAVHCSSGQSSPPQPSRTYYICVLIVLTGMRAVASRQPLPIFLLSHCRSFIYRNSDLMQTNHNVTRLYVMMGVFSFQLKITTTSAAMLLFLFTSAKVSI